MWSRPPVAAPRGWSYSPLLLLLLHGAQTRLCRGLIQTFVALLVSDGGVTPPPHHHHRRVAALLDVLFAVTSGLSRC